MILGHWLNLARKRGKMKSRLVGISIYSLVLMVTLQWSCDSQVKPSSTHSSDVNVLNGPNASDKDLLRQVEIFASGDATASSKAWETLQSYGRQNVIDNLTRLYEATPTDDYHRVLIAYTFCMLNHDYAGNREIVRSALAENRPFKQFFGDWAVYLVRSLMLRGDKDLIGDLLAAVAWSDGAMTEELATAYSQAIAAEPQTFLQELSSQSEKSRRTVYRLLQDNSLTVDEIERVKVFLESIPASSKLHETAQEAIKALQGERSSSSR
jgi:hypothetical protein